MNHNLEESQYTWSRFNKDKESQSNRAEAGFTCFFHTMIEAQQRSVKGFQDFVFKPW